MLPKCKWSPCLCDVMTDRRVILVVGLMVLTLVILSQVLPYTRFGKMNPYRDTVPDKSILASLSDTIKEMTLLEGLRVMLGVLLPMLGTMVVQHPGSVALVCVLKKAVMLERRLWYRWCPEAYIIMVSVACMLVVARRSSFSQKLSKHDRFKRQSHAHFYNPDPRYNYGMA
ncbi:hypothetical protein ACOMHN_030128 [Nucella lapillus]